MEEGPPRSSRIIILQLLVVWSAAAAASAAIFTAALPPAQQPQPGMPTSAGHLEAFQNDASKPQGNVGQPDRSTASSYGMTSSRSLLQLNVINTDGNLTEVVYPDKQVALELQAAHHGRFGVPVVRECTVTNPLQSKHGGRKSLAFSQIVLTQGCGLGETLPSYSRFRKSQNGYTTPSFPLPSSWTQQTALLFACDVIICADVRRCQQSCPPSAPPPPSHSPNQVPNVTALGPHDVIVRMESQVVTSCPQQNDDHSAWQNDVKNHADRKMAYLPDCFSAHGSQVGEHPQFPLTDDGQKNFTAAAGASERGDVINKGSPVTSVWPAGHVHFVIVVMALGLMIILFVSATLCKMVALQRQVERCNKMIAARTERDATLNDHTNQETQTPRPTARIQNTRSQTSARYSRERESATIMGMGSRSSDSCPLPAKSLSHDEGPSGFPSSSTNAAQEKGSAQFGYDVPPSSPNRLDKERMSSGFLSAQGPSPDRSDQERMSPGSVGISSHRPHQKGMSSGSCASVRGALLCGSFSNPSDGEFTSPTSPADENDSPRHTPTVAAEMRPIAQSGAFNGSDHKDPPRQSAPLPAAPESESNDLSNNSPGNGDAVCETKETNYHHHQRSPEEQVMVVVEVEADTAGTSQRRGKPNAHQYYNLPVAGPLTPQRPGSPPEDLVSKSAIEQARR